MKGEGRSKEMEKGRGRKGRKGEEERGGGGGR